MDKLNELVEMAKEISSKSWFLNSDEEVTAIDNDAGPDDSEDAFIGCAANIQLAKYIAAASPENILTIAEAFRELEQRAEAAEAKLVLVREQRNSELDRNTELEAKLAWLEKQEPVAWRDPSNSSPSQACTYDPVQAGGWPHIFRQPLFTRAAPAVVPVDLLSLVPPVKDDSIPGKNDSYVDMCDGWNACRYEMLRRIEGLK